MELYLIATIILLSATTLILLYFGILSKPRSLHGLVCVLTGGAGAMGQSLTKLLLHRGVKVVVWDNSSENIASMRTCIDSDDCYFFEVDVSSVAAVEKAAQEVITQLGGVDILINNAALSNPFDLEESTPPELQSAVNVNLMSHMWTIRTFLPYLKRSPAYNGLRGSVVGMSSILGSVGTGGLQAYCASKAAVIGLMESLYMQHTGVHWCIVTPFLINTDLFRGMKHRYMNYIYPILDKEEVARTIVDGIERQKSYITIPWLWNYAFCLIKNAFPLYVMKLVENIFNVRVGYRDINQRRTAARLTQ